MPWERKCKGIGIQVVGNACFYNLQFADDPVIEYMTRKLKEKQMKNGVNNKYGYNMQW